MEALLKQLQSVYPLSTELKMHLKTAIKTKELPKKEILLKAGHVSREIYFINQGLLRCFYFKKHKEISAWFMKEGDFVISVKSFFRQEPSDESIQALEDCHLYYLTYNDLQFIYRNFMEFNYVGRILTEKYYTLSEERVNSMRSQPASERYAYLIKHYPDLVQRVPDKYLASYLGITPIRLSNIRSKKKS